MELKFTATDNNGKIYGLSVDGDDIIFAKEEVLSGVEYIDITTDKFSAFAGSMGYYVISDVDHKGSYLCRFESRKDCEFCFEQNLMPIFGVKKEGFCILGIVKGLAANFHIVMGVKDNGYYLKLRFYITAFGAYEDIRIGIVNLDESAEYSDMARVYREYQLERGVCVPLKERVKNSETLEYAVHAPEIRIRLGWKPAPPQICEQTRENEPEMHIACTFDRVKDFVDELKRQGVEKAQICLVGWNKSGHDGRYPEIFPVEEKLGGEEKLRELISHAQELGYQMVCHTNSTDCYSIADTFSKDIVSKKVDGTLSFNDTPWSGGTMYHLCPEVAVKYAKSDFPKIAEMGFKGIHYVDVMSVAPLRECYDENHECTKLQTLAHYEEIMKMSHETFGGYASEGAFDFVARYLDYALYVYWPAPDEWEFGELFNENIPLWQLVYHGIILANPSTQTVNYTIKGKVSEREFKECGGRPSFYIYSKFMTGGEVNWLGREDLILDTDEQLVWSVSKIKEGWDEYKKNSYLQYEYMTSHKKTEENGFEITYSNGDVVRG